MKNKIKNLLYRINNDYFMKNRYNIYEELITKLINANYQFITISEYKKLLNKGKHVIIRHDIDSDVKIARKMFEIEKKYNIKATYYFRKCTIDKELMKELNENNFEIGYHYEEIATYVKHNKLKSKEEIIKNMKDIQKTFEKNIKMFEKEFNISLKSIASHGDFINRKYSIPNNELFDKKMRKNFPHIIEAYDDVVEGNLDARISDGLGESLWHPINPFDAIDHNKRNILILVHTRWWDKAPLERLKNEIKRIIEGIKY